MLAMLASSIGLLCSFVLSVTLLWEFEVLFFFFIASPPDFTILSNFIISSRVSPEFLVGE